VLVFGLEYRGINIGRYRIEAHPAPGGGWRFRGAFEGLAVARLLGFDLTLASRTGADLATRRFEKRIRSPVEGEIRLLAEVGEEVRALRYQNGRLVGRYRARTRPVWDDLSLVYHIRVQPRAGELAFLGLYGVVRGPLRALGTRRVEVPAGRFRARTFRFDEPAAFFELDLSEKARLPVRIVFGYGHERLIARLIGRE